MRLQSKILYKFCLKYHFEKTDLPYPETAKTILDIELIKPCTIISSSGIFISSSSSSSCCMHLFISGNNGSTVFGQTAFLREWNWSVFFRTQVCLIVKFVRWPNQLQPIPGRTGKSQRNTWHYIAGSLSVLTAKNIGEAAREFLSVFHSKDFSVFASGRKEV